MQQSCIIICGWWLKVYRVNSEDAQEKLLSVQMTSKDQGKEQFHSILPWSNHIWNMMIKSGHHILKVILTNENISRRVTRRIMSLKIINLI